MMKYLLLSVLLLTSLKGVMAEEELLSLDAMLDQRIKEHEEARDKNVEQAKGYSVAKSLVPVEQDLGQGRVDFLRAVKDKGDEQLKIQILRIELLDEIRECYILLEIAQSREVGEPALKELEKWKKRYADLQKLAETKKSAAE